MIYLHIFVSDRKLPSFQFSPFFAGHHVRGFYRLPIYLKPLRLTRSKILSTLSFLPKTSSISFTVKPRKFTSGWSNVIHFSTGSKLSRLPAVFLRRNSIYICGYVNGNSNYQVHQKIHVNKWTAVQVVNARGSDGYYYWSVYLNGKLVHRVKNTTPKRFKNVRVYVTDPWYKPFVGTIRHLRIHISAAATTSN